MGREDEEEVLIRWFQQRKILTGNGKDRLSFLSSAFITEPPEAVAATYSSINSMKALIVTACSMMIRNIFAQQGREGRLLRKL